MPRVSPAPRLRPLSDVAGGEQIQIVEIIFDAVRKLCPAIGLNPGDILNCEERTARDIALRRSDGSLVKVDRFYATFIAIQSY